MSLTLSPDPFEAARELAAFEAARRAEDLETGGIVSFSGLVRADGGKVTGRTHYTERETGEDGSAAGTGLDRLNGP